MNIRNIALTLLLVPFVSFAQTGMPPSAGLTPQSPFYFLDRLGEVLQELVAFSPEAKVRVQISFAAERIAEIIIDMEAKDVDAKGLAVAQERLQAHLTKAANVTAKEKKKGRDVRDWEEMIKDEFEVSKNVLESSFKAAKDALEDEREEIKEALQEAKKSGDVVLREELEEKLDALEDEKDRLEEEREEQKQFLEDERERLDDNDDNDDDDDDDDDEGDEGEDDEGDEEDDND